MIRTFLFFWFVIGLESRIDDPNFFMFVKYNRTHINISCVVDNETPQNLAISRAETDTKKIDPNFTIAAEERAELFLYGNKLSNNISMGFPLPPVLDSRWNGFPFYRGFNLSTKNINGPGMAFSLLGQSLKIILNGSTNIAVEINQTTVTLNGELKRTLERRDSKWSHFILSWTARNFNISDENSRIILTHGYDSEINLSTATFEVRENSWYVLHEYFWYDPKNLTFITQKNEDCLDLYYSICETCFLNVNTRKDVKPLTIAQLQGVKGKWKQQRLEGLFENQVISINTTSTNDNKDLAALDVRKCRTKSGISTLSKTFNGTFTTIQCHSFNSSHYKVISYGSGTKVELLGTKIFNTIRNRTDIHRNNYNLMICVVAEKCYVPKSICNCSNHQILSAHPDEETPQNIDIQVYCQRTNRIFKAKSVEVLVRWRALPAEDMASYLIKFCENKNLEQCEELQPPKRCEINTWQNYICSSSYLKENFDYYLLVYRRYSKHEGFYMPVECKPHKTVEQRKIILTASNTTQEGILILKLTNSWNDVAKTSLKWQLKNDTNVCYYNKTKEDRELVYRMANVKPSATYKASLHVQTEVKCIDSEEIEVHTPPARLTLREPPVLNCTQSKCTIRVGGSMQATANSYLYLFVTDVSNKTIPNITINEPLPKSCGEVYDAGMGSWTSFNVSSNVNLFETRPALTKEAAHNIEFNLQNGNVSLNKMEVLLVDKYIDKVTCTLYKVNTKGYEKKSRINTKPKHEGHSILEIIVVVACLFAFVLIAVASFVVYKKKLCVKIDGRLADYIITGRNSVFRINVKPLSYPIEVNELEEYVKEAIKVSTNAEDKLTQQFRLCPTGQTRPWEYGKLAANSKKNRYKNIKAYDHSRVILTKLPGDDFSDYINANYVGEKESDQTYIATQGPKKSTTNDFWRMIWEQNCPVIIMLTKLFENDKPKCEQYWPDESDSYGEIVVSLVSQKFQADYCCRTFNLCKGNVNKQLTHFHYELWPDHGVPDCQRLASFMAAIPPPKSTGPQIIHCSAGCGRTGTLILAMISLKMARQTRRVDFLQSLATIRENRIDLVQNEEQYKVAHLLVLEVLFKEDYSVPCDGRLNFAIASRKSDVEEQVYYLEKVCWRDTALLSGDSLVEICRENYVKNRFPVIIPNVHSDYINAVLIEKFYASLSNHNFEEVEADYANKPRLQSSAEFIVTQQPLPNTIGDFWRMVLDKQVEVIVSLNKIDLQDQTSCVFWPQNGEEFNPTPFHTVRFMRKISDNDAYDVVMVEEKNEVDVGRAIAVILMKNWNAGALTPASKQHLLEMTKYIQALSASQFASDQPIVVTCHDGATASGLFLSLVTTLEMARIENVFDLCRIVRAIRKSRKEFMRKIEQFRFLYDAIATYFEDQPVAQRQVIYSNQEVLYSNWNGSQ